MTAYLVFLLWLYLCYTAVLLIFLRPSPGAAVWQAALCLAVAPPMLLAVLRVLSFPKLAGRLHRAALTPLWLVANLAQFVLPWLGWSALIWLMNSGNATWPGASRAGGVIAVLSYLTGAWLILRFRPRPEQVELTRVEIPIVGLPGAFDRYQILHLSDIHAGLFASVGQIAARLAVARNLRPDLVVFTGDLAESKAGSLEATAQLLAELATRNGIFAVLGNHDVWVGEDRVKDALRERRVRVLANEHVALRRSGAQLCLAGVSDTSYTGRGDLAAALAGIPEGVPVILLSHAPAVAREPLARRACLILSGHTHGGQVVLPAVGPIYVPSRLGRRYSSGLHQVNGVLLFINRGLGEVFPPMRINCPPEIALLTLRTN